MNNKLKIILFTFLLNTWCFNLVNGQNLLDTKTTENFSGVSLYEFIQIIEHDYNLHFFYRKPWITNITIPRVKPDETIKSILESALRPYSLSYIDIQQRNLILLPEDYTYFINDKQVDFFKVVGSPLLKGKYKSNLVEGQVLFGKTGEPLAGVLIIDKKNNKQTVSDYKGHYSLSLPGGRTKIKYSFMGLETNIVDVEVLSNGTLNVELMEAPIELDDVTITADAGRNSVNRTQMGMAYMDMKSINKLPVLMGEVDIIKCFTLLPGVSSSGEMSSGFNVRGGNVDQNLVLMNDAPIYGTSHVFGLFSTLIPNSVSSVNMHKGTQPANFGTRVSSVTEIKLKAADTLKVTGRAGIGILNSSLFLEGPIYKGKVNFMIGARKTYSNWVLKAINNIDIKNSKASFYDVIGKVDIKINPKNFVNIFFYNSSDDFTYSNKNDYKYGSLVGGINYNAYLNNTVSVHSSVSYTGYNSTVGEFADLASASRVKTGISQLNAKIESKIHFERNDIIAGIEGIIYTMQPGQKSTYGDESDAALYNLEKEKAREGAIFAHDDFKITERISFSGGLRYSWYSKVGEGTSYTYLENQPKNEYSLVDSTQYSSGEKIHPYNGLEPRAGIKFSLNSNSSIKAGYSLTRQYQHLITNPKATTPADYWKSADNTIKPLINQQVSLGYFSNFIGDIFETSLELYYKKSDNILDYKDGAVLSMNKHIEQDLVACQGKSYGLEILLKKNGGKLSGWLGYTLSKSLLKTESNFTDETIANGEYYPSYNDRLHDLSLALNYKLSRRWTLGANFVYSSPKAATVPIKRVFYHNNQAVIYSERNQFRLEPFHRLDVAITYEGYLKKTKKVHPSFTFSIYNLYGRNNIYSVYYKKDEPSAQNNYQMYGFYKLSIIGIPVPSFTINLKF